jgi:putative transcriptional regulator
LRTWLKVKRNERPQELIAKMAGISQQMYSRIERGKANPSVEVAKKIAAALDFDWTRFFPDDYDKQLPREVEAK